MPDQLAIDPRQTTIEELLRRWREEAVEHRRTEAEAKGAAERKERAVAALEEALGLAQPSDPAVTAKGLVGAAIRRVNSEMRGIAAVRAVVAEDPTRVWRPNEIHEILAERGWLNEDAKHPLSGTEAAISRLVHRKELERVGRGEYRFNRAGVKPED